MLRLGYSGNIYYLVSDRSACINSCSSIYAMAYEYMFVSESLYCITNASFSAKDLLVVTTSLFSSLFSSAAAFATVLPV